MSTTRLQTSHLLSRMDRIPALKLEEAPQFIREISSELAEFIRLSGAGFAALIEAAVLKASEVKTLETPAPPASASIAKAALTVKEAAEVLSVSLAGMRLRIARREISVVRLGRLIRVPKTELDRLLSENLVPARGR